MAFQTRPEQYFGPSYNTKSRFVNYWHQINELIKLEPSSILEIGIGNGFVSNYLIRMGYDVITIDIDRGLKPKVVGSVVKLPFADNSFDAVACFEVLEHLPYEQFVISLGEIRRVSKNYALLSLPDSTEVMLIHIYIPKLGKLKKLFNCQALGYQNMYLEGYTTGR